MSASGGNKAVVKDLSSKVRKASKVQELPRHGQACTNITAPARPPASLPRTDRQPHNLRLEPCTSSKPTCKLLLLLVRGWCCRRNIDFDVTLISSPQNDPCTCTLARTCMCSCPDHTQASASDTHEHFRAITVWLAVNLPRAKSTEPKAQRPEPQPLYATQPSASARRCCSSND